LSDSNEPEFSIKIFEKYSNIKLHENPSSWSRDIPCGRTDRHRHDEGNRSFSQFWENRLKAQTEQPGPGRYLSPGPTEYETRALIVRPRRRVPVSLKVHLAQLYTMQIRPRLRMSATSLRDHALTDGYQTFRIKYCLQLYPYPGHLSN